MVIDLRSDTVTRPTTAMKAFMFDAPLGDDVFGDDPTVNELEAKAAQLFGMEAALYCASGTMTNQLAIKVHTQPGDQVICSHYAHIYNYEGGGIALNSHCSSKLIPGAKGMFTAQDVIDSLNPDDPHFPVSKLVSIENTSNKGGGALWNNEAIKEISQTCTTHNLKLHLDGARLFDAMVTDGSTPQFYGEQFDSISICLSKGLGAPVGSLLLGTKDFIAKARRFRKSFGGGMRQAGLIAAAGIYALDHHVDRLKKDHDRAQYLAQEWGKKAHVEKIVPVETNIVIAQLKDKNLHQPILDEWKENGLLAASMGPGLLRLVTHLDFGDEQMEKTIEIINKVC